MEYSYCSRCKCWHSIYDKCDDVIADKISKNGGNNNTNKA